MSRHVLVRIFVFNLIHAPDKGFLISHLISDVRKMLLLLEIPAPTSKLASFWVYLMIQDLCF